MTKPDAAAKRRPYYAWYPTLEEQGRVKRVCDLLGVTRPASQRLAMAFLAEFVESQPDAAAAKARLAKLLARAASIGRGLRPRTVPVDGASCTDEPATCAEPFVLRLCPDDLPVAAE